MPLLPLIAFVILTLQLCACSTDPNKKADIDGMEHRHAEWMETMGGGGGM